MPRKKGPGTPARVHRAGIGSDVQCSDTAISAAKPVTARKKGRLAKRVRAIAMEQADQREFAKTWGSVGDLIPRPVSVEHAAGPDGPEADPDKKEADQ